MKKHYQAPTVRFENLRLRENIADQCWAFDSTGYSGDLYYDRKNIDGYTKFKISGYAGNCGNNKDKRQIKVIYSEGNDVISASSLLDLGPSFTGISKSISS